MICEVCDKEKPDVTKKLHMIDRAGLSLRYIYQCRKCTAKIFAGSFFVAVTIIGSGLLLMMLLK